jgi:cytochrome c biogenesis protein CcmG/thiol:disulfide interchange protein DsbE
MCSATWLACSAPVAAQELVPWKGGATPALSLRDTEGDLRTLAQLRGKVVIVNFWATWCEPCIAEMPSLQALKARHGADRVEIIGVNLGESEARIRGFASKTAITFPLLSDRDGVAKKAWEVRGVPSSFVIDSKGKVRFSVVGQVDFEDEDIDAEIVKLLPRKK